MQKQKKRILVVEDTPSISKAVLMALEGAGFEVEMCVNGTEGLKKIRSDNFDLILLDLVMPGKTGFEVLSELKMLEEDVPIMVYSSMAEQFSKEEALKLGAKDYFEKGKTTIQELVKKVKKYSSN